MDILNSLLRSYTAYKLDSLQIGHMTFLLSVAISADLYPVDFSYRISLCVALLVYDILASERMGILYKMLELMVCTKSLSAKGRKYSENAKMSK